MKPDLQQYRVECEVRYVASMDKDRRQAFYLLVTKHRGEEAAKTLAKAVKELLQARSS